jgi:uncharacterized repeat protein (TIGR01451 family)
MSQQIVDDARVNGPGVRHDDMRRAGAARFAVHRRVVVQSLLAMAAALSSLNATAQIQRGLVNRGFEQPSSGTTSCYFTIGSAAVPGWTTNHPAATSSQPNSYCPPNITAATPGATTGGQIEIWTNDFSGIPALSGTQYAELNVYKGSRMSQSACVLAGETVGFSMGHRGRGSATVGDVAEFNIDSSANAVFRASTTNNGSGGVVQCGGTAVAATDGPVSGAADGLVASPTCSSAIATGGWRRYSGTFAWNGTSGVHDFGFESVSSSGGGPRGNYVDDLSVALRPVIEFTNATGSSREGAGTPLQPVLTVVGTVPAGGMPITVTVTGGTATNGTDYTLGTFTVPAGDYAAPTALSMDGLVTVIDDTVIEDNETIQLQIGPSPDYALSSASVCGSAAQSTMTFTIVDNDVDVRTIVSAANANPPPGGTTTFTVTYQNDTAQPTVGDVTAHDASSNLADALPAGFSTYTWTCTASGTPAPVCPAASGSGAIAAIATLPAGNAGAAGGTLTYTVTGTVGEEQCSAMTDTSTVAIADAAVTEGTSAQADYTTPAPGGTANNTASTGVDPGCLTLNKTTLGGAGGPFTFALTNTAQTSGTVTTATAGTPVQVDGNAAAGTQPFGISAVGTAVTINESALPANFALSATTCSNGSTNVGSLAGSTYTIDAADVTAGTDYTCTFTNTAGEPQLTLVKTASSATFSVDVPASYTLSVTNTGNAATTDAATVSDNVPAGLTLGAMPAGCTASGQAVSCTVEAGLAPGASVAFVIPVTPTAAVGATTVTNAATVSGGDAACPQAATCNSSVSVAIVARLMMPIPALGAPMLAGLVTLLGLIGFAARSQRRVGTRQR